MFFVNVVSMKIPITIFICIATSEAQSTGSDSSILESKVRGGSMIDSQFNLLYVGFLRIRRIGLQVALVTFINEHNCMTTREWGAEVQRDKGSYEVLIPVRHGRKEYKISEVLVPDEDDHVAAYFSILKLKRFSKNPTNYVSFVNTRVPSFKMEEVYYVGGWNKNLFIPELRYLKMRLGSFKRCKAKINKKFHRLLHNLACATTKDGEFDEFDLGTPLFMGDNEMLGVTVAFNGSAAIFALVYNDIQLIKAFRDRDGDLPVGAGEGTDDDIGEAPGESSNAYPDPRCGANTPYLYDTSHMHPGQMGSSHQYDMGNMNSGQMGSSYQYDMGRMNPGLMSTPYLPDMTRMNLGQTGTQYQYNMGYMIPGQTDTPHQYDMGHMNPGQMGTSHLPNTSHMNRGDIGFHSQDQMGSQDTTDTDDLMSIFRPRKPIKTRREQSSDAHQTHDGSRSARLSGTMFESPDVQAGIRVADTSRATGVKLLRNPRTRGHLPKK